MLEGEVEFLLGDRLVEGTAGDFVNVPRGTVHCFRNDGTKAMRMIVTFSPAGIEHFFEETLDPAVDPTQDPPDNIEELVVRFAAAAPRHGLEFVAA